MEKSLSVATDPAPVPVPHHQPSVALVLGGGGARGLAHIGILEVFDELGVTPKVIAGTSIGAIFGSAYASGISGVDLRQHTVDLLTRRRNLLRDVFSGGALSPRSALKLLGGRGSLLTPEALLDVVLPKQVADTFEDLQIPLHIVASDYYALEEKVFTSGPLKPAVAASMALPVVFRPVTVEGRTLIDGGFVNPLPFDLLDGLADILVAVDVSGVTKQPEHGRSPSMLETLFSVSFFFERSLVREKLKARQPDIYIEAGTGTFNVLDFLKVTEILEKAEPAKARFKTQLLRALQAHTVAVDE